MRRRLLRGIVLNGLGSGSVAAVALVRNVIIARVMGPAAFGLWQLCLVALRLAGESHVGALDALVRDGPVHRGAGRSEEARGLERNAVGVAIAFSLVAGVVAGLLIRWRGGAALAVTAVLLAVTMILQQWFLADATVLRARGRFGTMTVLQVTFACAHLAGLVLLVPSHFLSGALAAWLGGVVVASLVVRRVAAGGLPLPGAGALRAAGRLLSRGSATWLVSVTFLLLLQVDRVVVYLFLGQGALGLYGILLLGGSAMLFVPDVVTGILWPLVGERYGSAGEDASVVTPVVEQTLLALAPVLAALTLLAIQATEVLVTVALRNYTAALDALRIYLVGIYLVCLAMPIRYLLVTVHRDRSVLRIQIWSLLLTIAATCAAAAGGVGIAGVAGAVALSAAVLLACLLACARSALDPAPRLAMLAGGVVVPVAVALGLDRGLALVVPRYGFVEGVLLRLGVPLVLVVITVGIVVAIRLPLRATDGGTADED